MYSSGLKSALLIVYAVFAVFGIFPLINCKISLSVFKSHYRREFCRWNLRDKITQEKTRESIGCVCSTEVANLILRMDEILVTKTNKTIQLPFLNTEFTRSKNLKLKKIKLLLQKSIMTTWDYIVKKKEQ